MAKILSYSQNITYGGEKSYKLRGSDAVVAHANSASEMKPHIPLDIYIPSLRREEILALLKLGLEPEVNDYTDAGRETQDDGGSGRRG